MPDTYQSDESIPELGGTIKGGVTVVMHNPQDLNAITALCAFAADSDAPMHALYGLINKRHSPITGSIESLWPHWSEMNPDDFDHPGRSLIVACSYIHDLWQKAPDPKEFNATLTIARPERDMRLDIDVAQPGLVLHRGSLLATLASGPLSVFGWSLALFSARGIGATTRAKRIMEDLRATALTAKGAQPLERLDNLPPGYLKGKTSLIILMHGLLSTDAGLFDPLLQHLHADPAFEDCAIVGWPHNTLESIDDNAVELLPVFGRVIGIDGPNICFICHSRGGLVARATAVELYQANQKWLGKLKGCVTFGTPHDGSPLAEAPGDLLGKLVAVQAFRGGAGFFSLSDALHFVHQQGSIQGILDLRPLGGGGTFLQNLLRAEAQYAPPGCERALPILAIGGKSDQKGFFAELSRRALAGTDNDLIVETNSSATRYSTKQLVLPQCNHFEYFLGSQSDAFGTVTGFLKQHLALKGKTSEDDQSIVETQRDITVRQIRLKKRHANYTAAKPSTAP